MFSSLFALLLISAPGFAEKPAEKELPAKKDLFAQEAWYKDQKGKEEEFVGVLERAAKPGDGVVGFGRMNPYRLVMGESDKKSVREVYVGSKPDLLAPYVGKKIKLIGKAVDIEVEGRDHREIWPARLEVLGEIKGGPGKEPPARAVILGDHKLYKMEPGQEKELVGVLEKKEKGGYALVMKDVREDLILYGDAGDPLAPYVGKKVKVFGKQVAGAVGFRNFRHTLPGRLEVLDAGKEGGEKPPKEESQVKPADSLRK
jgi:hypothetical protein